MWWWPPETMVEVEDNPDMVDPFEMSMALLDAELMLDGL
jgi:hypothetical protein